MVGALLFAGQLVGIGLGDLGWPFIIIAVGVAILGLGLFAKREQGMVIGGTVVTTVGSVLAYQTTTGHWESWAYAWALVGPAASGLGLALWGIRTAHGRAIRNGTWVCSAGLALFVIGFLFFEGVIGTSGERFPIADWMLAAAVIAIGVPVLVHGLVQRNEPDTT